MEAEVEVPENFISGVFVGQRAEVRLPNRPGATLAATISKIGSAAVSSNSFPVRARITDTDPELRPGMSAELWLFFGDSTAPGAFTVPMHALVDGSKADARYVFVYDRKNGTVARTAVETGGLAGDEVVVTGGLSAGDIVVVAGASFLRDGQPVKLLDPSQAER
jgi:RND family efflux transporter MFP subunit